MRARHRIAVAAVVYLAALIVLDPIAFLAFSAGAGVAALLVPWGDA